MNLFDVKIDEPKRRRYRNLNKTYDKRRPLYDEALTEAQKSLEEIKKLHTRDAKLRIAYIDGRVKELQSIVRKACKSNVPASKVFKKFEDILGLRVVVNNVSDIDGLIKEIEKHPRFRVLKRKVKQGDSPYKAVHLTVTYSWKDGSREKKVTCELQIRTLMQDTWAILTHHDVYRNQADLSELAKVIAKYMSDACGALDSLADDFRKQIAAQIEPPNDLSDKAPLDKQGEAISTHYEVSRDDNDLWRIFFEPAGSDAPEPESVNTYSSDARQSKISDLLESLRPKQ